jgi:predicted enzyme related to lactoylglutathione lyase
VIRGAPAAADKVSTVAAAVLYVKDLRAMRTFYQRCFGMSMLASDEPDVCLLANDEWELALVSVPAAVAATLEITDPPRRRANTPIKLAFEVASIDAIQSAVAGAGGQIDPLEMAWDYRDHRHVDCVDPEGNVVQLRQRRAEK